jgi:NAD(P)H-flavin reductase
MERSMHCAIGLCGHCQLQHLFVCKDGPVFPLDAIEPLLRVREL